MSTQSPADRTPASYQSVGLISNPFRPREPFTDASYPGADLIAHAAANELLVAITSAADKTPATPIWVEKAGDLPLSYYVGPLAETLAVLGEEGSGLSLLAGYVPLDMMRLGRARAVLSVIAERTAGVQVDLTIAAWMRHILAEPDVELAEFEAVSMTDLAGLAAALEADPTSAVERYFGSCVPMREGVKDLELLMRISTARQDSLELDPNEQVDAVVGEAPQDEFSEAFTGSPQGPTASSEVQPDTAAEATPAGGEAASEGTAAPEPDDGLPRVEDLITYVVAYTSAHLSPVIARALRAYRAQGYTSMTEELKVTKAPTKTLAALVRFASCRYRKVVILFDRFDVWENVPEDLRLKILGTLAQLRGALREGAVLAFLAGTNQVPELEEQFGTAIRVTWDMPGLAELEGIDPPFDLQLAQGWLDVATTPGCSPIQLAEEPLAGLVASSDGSLRGVAARLAAAIDDSAARGLARVDEAAVTAALSLSHGND